MSLRTTSATQTPYDSNAAERHSGEAEDRGYGWVTFAGVALCGLVAYGSRISNDS